MFEVKFSVTKIIFQYSSTMKRIKHLFHLCKESLFHGIHVYPISFSSHKSECETLGVKLTLGIKDEPGAARLELEDQELLLSPC